MKQHILLIVLCAVAGLSCDPNNPDASAASENFLPLSAGNSWTYDEHVVGEGLDTMEVATVTMSGPIMFDSIAWYGVNNFCVSRVPSSPLPMFCAAWGTRGNQVLFTRQGPGPVQREYELLLDFPLWVGKSWLTKPNIDTSYVTSGGDTIVSKWINRRVYHGRRAVIVPAGSFLSCLEVIDSIYEAFRLPDTPEGTGDPIDMIVRTTEWYSKDVGLVKQVIETSVLEHPELGITRTRVLRKYSVKGI